MTAHGGKRPGSGRPRSADPGRLVAIRLTAEELRLLATIAPSVSEAIHAILADKTDKTASRA